ncbi:MAG: NADH-quinone oxidoreductase subunit G, partial [Deltaproteobacteria bacterium]
MPDLPNSPLASKPENAAPAAPAPPQPPAAPAGHVNIEVDGRPLQVKAGTNLIEAANQLDVRIPFYCYHQKLTIAANCRMCLVKVSNAPKLVPACQTPATEGLKVTTNSPEVMDSHRSVQEFLLYNHPVDCAICDQAGECKLQDYYMQYDHRPYRPTQPKVLRHKRKALGPLVVLDQERCILCTRCVRFMKEIPKEPQLGVFGRGNREYIDVFPGHALDSRYAGNTIDICPVGALLSRDFRFKARAFFLSQTPSVCTGCARGCNTFLDHYDGVSYRYRPRENDAVNSSWMCDDGRLTYHRLNEERALAAIVGRVGAGKPTPIAAALTTAAERLLPFKGQVGLAVLVSPQLSVEDLLAVLLLAKEGLGATAIYEGGHADGEQDELLLQADKNPNRAGLRLVAKGFGLELRPFQSLVDAAEEGKVKALYVAGTDVPIDGHMAAAVFEPLDLLVVQSVHANGLAGAADVLLPASPHAEDDGLFVNFQGRAQRFARAYPPSGESQPHWRLAADLLKSLGFTWRFSGAREVFEQLRARVPELAEIVWSDLGPNAAERQGIVEAAAA